jgi:hypothetical protein
VKASERVESFDPFLTDGFGNIIQMKTLDGIDWPLCREEIGRLTINAG